MIFFKEGRRKTQMPQWKPGARVRRFRAAPDSIRH
jgi:hypothetical protein